MKVGLFPGQGIPQDVVLRSLPESGPRVERARDALGFDLRASLEEAAARPGTPPTTLMQPAIFVASMTGWDDLRAQDRAFGALAGHSLGEYAALVAAGSIGYEDALTVLKERSAAMQDVSVNTPGGMAAVLRLDIETVHRIATETGVLVANDNAPGQVVVSGAEPSLDLAAAAVASQGGRFMRLEIVGPFHTAAVEPAAKRLEAALDTITVTDPKIPVVSNVTARPFGSATEIKALLVKNLTVGVRWRETLTWMWDEGAREFHDVGPGQVVDKLARRIFGTLDKANT